MTHGVVNGVDKRQSTWHVLSSSVTAKRSSGIYSVNQLLNQFNKSVMNQFQ